MYSFLKTNSLISNQWVNGQSSETLTVKNKYDQSLLAEISLIDSSQMEQAISSCQAALPVLKDWDAGKRSDHLYKLYELLKDKQDSFAQLICAEAGKPIAYARAEVARCLTTLKMCSEEARRVAGEVVAMDFDAGIGKQAYTKRFPLGVIGCISPFNFPLNLALHKIGPALAAGNSVIIKPSPYTPLTLLAFGDLIKEAGFPKGAVNIVICDNFVAEQIVCDPRIAMLSFTGSPKVGWELKEKARKKKVTLELGGNAAVIVDKSADVEFAAASVATGAFLYSGQICISTQRVYVDASIYDEFIDKLLLNTDEIICGDPSREEVSVGPIIDSQHLSRIHSWVTDATFRGAKILTGGHILDEEHNIYAPTILTDTSPDMEVVSSEVFGPIVIVERTDYFDDAVALVNDSRFGLQAGLFTNQIEQMKYAFNKLEVGALLINAIPGFRIDNMPYGGVKDSGLGREGVKYAIEDMTEPRLLIF